MTADRLRQLAAEAGFEQIMKHKDGSTTVLPDALFERFAALVLQDNQAPAEAHGLSETQKKLNTLLCGVSDFLRQDLNQNRAHDWADRCEEMLVELRASNVQPKGMPAEWLDAFEEWRQTLGAADLDGKRDLVWRHIAGTGFQAGAAWARSQAPAPAPELSDEDILRIWRKHYPTSVPGQLTIMAARDVIAADRTRQAPAVADGAEAWGYINERGEPVKFADAQQHKRDESYLRMAGLPVLYAVASKPPVQGTGDANG